MSRLNEKLKFRVSPEDMERIKVKMEDTGILNMSAYIREMALDGICVRECAPACHLAPAMYQQFESIRRKSERNREHL